MKFSTEEEIAAPIETVFAALTDIDRFEAAAEKRGIEVARTDDGPAPAAGTAWQIGFDLAGTSHKVDAEVTDFTPPGGFTLNAHSGGLDGVGVVTLAALDPARTRLALSFDLRPRTLSARLLLQTIRLAKANLEHHLEAGIGRLARELEDGNAD